MEQTFFKCQLNANHSCPERKKIGDIYKRAPGSRIADLNGEAIDAYNAICEKCILFKAMPLR